MQPPVLQALAADPSFWQFYYGLDTDPPAIVESTFPPDTEGDLVLVTSMPVPGAALEIDIHGEFWSIDLGLLVDGLQDRREMGWFDEARWHPNALRWPELDLLTQSWSGRPEASIWSLLLVPFVGSGATDREQLSRRRQIAAERLGGCGVPDSDAVALATEAVHEAPEEDYEWRHDPELGWLFSGEYPCYSIRNREHAEGSCGRFPFQEWAGIISRLEGTD